MFGFAKKIGMTRLFVEGKMLAVTVLQFEKQYVLQQKSVEKDGYEAVQIGSVNSTHNNKPKSGHIKKHGNLDLNLRFITECKDKKVLEVAAQKNEFDIADFGIGDLLSITGTSMGTGFTGVVKRYHFGGQPASHGHEHKRARGSIGSRWPQRTLPGTKMSGRRGSQTVTIKKAKIIEIDTENNLMFVKGSLPGTNSSYLTVLKSS